jgi:hypothetical protein
MDLLYARQSPRKKGARMRLPSSFYHSRDVYARLAVKRRNENGTKTDNFLSR